MSVNLKANPFYLNDEQIHWVKDTLASLTREEKIGQIFCNGISKPSAEAIQELAVNKPLGGIMIRPMPGAAAQQFVAGLQAAAKVPMLIAANLENGADGAVAEGINYGMPEGCAATGDVENGYRLGKVSAHQASLVGVNWAFAPIVDIDHTYRNPIINTRSFGSDPEVVAEMSSRYMKAAKEENVAVSIKHFPGDGCDERDQHLLVSVNDRSYEEYMDTYGKIYQRMIREGAETFMAGHIAQPAVVRHINPDATREEAYMPGSQSKELVTAFLRNELGFNGLVVTDSTLMVGYLQKMPRKQALAASINAGVDVILFNRNLDEDWQYMRENLDEGVISEERLDEAVTRVLALKANLHLPEKKASGTLVPQVDVAKECADPVMVAWMKECADKAVTLVKDNRHLLPMSPEKTKRIYLNVIEAEVVNNSPFALDIKHRLEKEGFEVTLRERAMKIDMEAMLSGEITPDMMKIMQEIGMKTSDFTSQYDACFILVNIPAASNTTTVRVNWEVFFGLGNDIPWYAGEMPCFVMSTGNPYHLLDIPMADVYVNAYTATPVVLDAAFDKLMGRSAFKGKSPVDPFCGHEDTMI